MIEIKDLLSRFNNLLLSEERKIDVIKKIISNLLKIEIKKEEIKIKNNIIYLNIKPIYKNEVFINREKIYLSFKKELGVNFPKEIR